MDLFGDLPTAKNSRGGSQSKAIHVTHTADASVPPNEIESSEIVEENAVKPVSSIAPTSTSGSSLKKQLGKAGTTFAFVPAALRNKNKSASTTTPKPNKNVISTSNLAKTSAQTKSSLETGMIVPVVEVVTSSLNEVDVHRNNTQDDTSEMRDDQAAEDEEIRQLHLRAAEVEASMSQSKQIEANHNFDYSRIDLNNMTPYDPMIPNDYLAYKEGQKKRRRRVELERSTREALQQQGIMRERIEEERKKAEQSGDISKIIESRQNPAFPAQGMGKFLTDTCVNMIPIVSNKYLITKIIHIGRGRGRGMSNLPAWLVKKQEEEQALKSKEQESVPISSSRLVILSNMIAPGEVDHELAEEVKDECEGRCGRVLSVKVKQADEHNSDVRVFVLFELPNQAREAVTLFHGRNFGGRRVNASIADEALCDT